MSGQSEATVDPTRRTQLASERTYLAWWRTGLTSFAVSVAIGGIVPEFASGSAWPYGVLGVAYGVLGVVFVGYGFKRLLAVDRALSRGEHVRPDARFAAALTLVGIALGIATVLVIAIQR